MEGAGKSDRRNRQLDSSLQTLQLQHSTTQLKPLNPIAASRCFGRTWWIRSLIIAEACLYVIQGQSPERSTLFALAYSIKRYTSDICSCLGNKISNSIIYSQKCEYEGTSENIPTSLIIYRPIVALVQMYCLIQAHTVNAVHAVLAELLSLGADLQTAASSNVSFDQGYSFTTRQ